MGDLGKGPAQEGPEHPTGVLDLTVEAKIPSDWNSAWLEQSLGEAVSPGPHSSDAVGQQPLKLPAQGNLGNRLLRECSGPAQDQG